MKKVSLQKCKGKTAYEDFPPQPSQSGEPWCTGRPLAQKTIVKSEKSSSISLSLYKSMARTKHFDKQSRGGSNPSKLRHLLRKHPEQVRGILHPVQERDISRKSPIVLGRGQWLFTRFASFRSPPIFSFQLLLSLELSKRSATFVP